MVDQVPPIWRFYSGVNEELCVLKQSITRTQVRRNGNSTVAECWDSVAVLVGERIIYGQTLGPSLWPLDYSNNDAPDTGFPQWSHAGSEKRLSASQRRTCLPRRDFRQFWPLSEHLARRSEPWVVGSPQFNQDYWAMHPSSPLFKSKPHVRTPKMDLGRSLDLQIWASSQCRHTE